MLLSRARSEQMEASLGMTAIDPHGDIELNSDGDRVIAQLPLTEPVTEEWLRRYESMAAATDVPARAHAAQGRAWIIVQVPADGRSAQVADTMSRARDLVRAVDAAGDRSPESRRSPGEAGVREWWASTRAESRWPMALTLAVPIAIQFALPARFSLGPDWLVPAILVLAVLALVIVDHIRFAHRAIAGRVLTVAIAIILVANGAGVTARLVDDLVSGGPETSSPSELLSIGFGVWIYTVIAFAFLYWVVDSGGATARRVAPSVLPDLAFPQHLNPEVRALYWRPRFADYLYLGFTNATAFSPTDVMPLALWAKVAMTVQAFGSLAVLGLVIARAVNILK
jgi:hypothetical protein